MSLSLSLSWCRHSLSFHFKRKNLKKNHHTYCLDIVVAAARSGQSSLSPCCCSTILCDLSDLCNSKQWFTPGGSRHSLCSWWIQAQPLLLVDPGTALLLVDPGTAFAPGGSRNRLYSWWILVQPLPLVEPGTAFAPGGTMHSLYSWWNQAQPLPLVEPGTAFTHGGSGTSFAPDRSGTAFASGGSGTVVQQFSIGSCFSARLCVCSEPLLCFWLLCISH